jgi:hypothetical protein
VPTPISQQQKFVLACFRRDDTKVCPSARDRLAELIHGRLVGGLDGMDDLLHILAAGRAYIQTAARCGGEKVPILHRIVERLLQRRNALARHSRRQHDRKRGFELQRIEIEDAPRALIGRQLETGWNIPMRPRSNITLAPLPE